MGVAMESAETVEATVAVVTEAAMVAEETVGQPAARTCTFSTSNTLRNS